MTMLLTLSPTDLQQSVSIAANDPRYGGTLVWGTINPPTLINPVLTSHSISASILELLFDPLVHVDQHGQVVPALARSWEISSDGLRYIFHLHPQVYFHDGVECTAEDVKFTYDAIQQASNNSPGRSHTEFVKEWQVLDRYTVEAVLEHPVSNFLLGVFREILPKHLYEHTDLAHNPHNYDPIGTGPFRFQSWDQRTNEMVLTANEDYFEGRPFLDKVIVKTYADNSALWAALMRGEVDFVNFLNQQDYQVLGKDRDFRTYQFPSGFCFAVDYNLKDPILRDREIRHAISYAVDREGLMQALAINGIASNGPFYPLSPWFNKKIEPALYDPERTQKILTARGWKLGPEGIFKKTGRALILNILVNRNRPDARQMVLILRQQLSEAGIALKPIFYDDDSQLTKSYLEKVKPQMWFRMFYGLNGEPSKNVLSWYSSSSEFAQLWPYHNSQIDRLFKKGLGLQGDQRIKVYQEIQDLLYQDQPACFLFFPVIYNAVSVRVENTEKFFNDFMPVYSIRKWFILNGKEVGYGNYQSRY